MKKLLFIVAISLFSVAAFAQQLNYQVVVRDNNQQLVTNTAVTANVTVKVSGTQVYAETVNGTTNLHGLLDFTFGDATFSTIDWANASISVQVLNASTNVVYVPAQDRAVNAVPYALTAASPSIPTALSAFTNDVDYVNNTACNTVSFCDLYSMMTDMQNIVSAQQRTIAQQDSVINAMYGLLSDILPFECGKSTVKDHEGNVYHTVQIGNQCWMKENMRCTTSPSTGTSILENPVVLYSYSGKKAYYYNNDPTMAENGYGLLYNWCAAVDTFNILKGETSVDTAQGAAVNVTFVGNRRGICPQGWHIPSDADWTTMENAVVTEYQPSVTPNPAFAEMGFRGTNTAIASLLVSGDAWNSSSMSLSPGDYNSSVRNATGFSALPAGSYSIYVQRFMGKKGFANFWSATIQESPYVLNRALTFSIAGSTRSKDPMSVALPVRCVRD